MSYKSILKSFKAETVEKKSRFIAFIFPVDKEDEAKALWLKLKKEHHQANHACYAYRLTGNLVLERYSDDGEPQGTAGMPMLEVLRGNSLENVIAIVVRYFGGTKLGTGGLVRAYTTSIQNVIANAELVEIKTIRPVDVTLSYHLSGKVQHFFIDESIYIEETHYETDVKFHLLVDEGDVDELSNKLTDMTAGQCELKIHDAIRGYKIDKQINRLGR